MYITSKKWWYFSANKYTLFGRGVWQAVCWIIYWLIAFEYLSTLNDKFELTL
jgi:hypothetical protein